MLIVLLGMCRKLRASAPSSLTSPAQNLRLHACAGALFVATDLFLTYGQPQRLIQFLFRRHANPKMKRADVDRAVPHASTRIVAFIHILIQARAAAS